MNDTKGRERNTRRASTTAYRRSSTAGTATTATTATAGGKEMNTIPRLGRTDY